MCQRYPAGISKGYQYCDVIGVKVIRLYYNIFLTLKLLWIMEDQMEWEDVIAWVRLEQNDVVLDQHQLFLNTNVFVSTRVEIYAEVVAWLEEKQLLFLRTWLMTCCCFVLHKNYSCCCCCYRHCWHCCCVQEGQFSACSQWIAPILNQTCDQHQEAMPSTDRAVAQ